MKRSKRVLAAVTAAAMSVSCLLCADLTVFAETDDTALSADSMTVSECIDYVNEMSRTAEQYAPEVGIYSVPVSNEEGEIIQKVLDSDYGKTENIRYEYKYQKYDFSSDYYYAQLPAKMQKAYDQLDEACLEFLSSPVNLSTDVFKEVIFESPFTSTTELDQLYWSFYYSNPQYFFLMNYYGYYLDGSGIILRAYANCYAASDRATIKNSIDSLTDEYINSVSSLTDNVAKETAIARKISDRVTYSTSAPYNQSLMSALYYKSSVCNGYAMSMNYFCNALGLDCIIVTNNYHAWNRVKLNGLWYETDVTWYDQGTYYWDKWLNKSTATFLANDQDNMHVVNTAKPMYSNITLPSCTDDDPTDNPPSEEETPSSTKPANVTAVPGTNSVTLSWDAVPGAARYAVSYHNGSGYTILTETCTATTYTAAGLTAGRTYPFLVQAFVNGQWSPFTSADHVAATPAGSTVTSTKSANVKAVPGTNSVTLSWDAVPGAARYAVSYHNGSGYTILTEACSATTYTAAGLTAGKTYPFLVQAFVNGQWSPFTSADHVSVTIDSL